LILSKKNPFSSPSLPTAPLVLSSPKFQALAALRQHGRLARIQIAEMIGYSPSKITSVVNELIDAGIVEETEDSSYTGGRRAKDLYFSPNCAYIVAAVIDADKLDLALVDATETIRVRRMLPIQTGDSPSRILDSLSQFILERLEKLAIPIEKVYGVGISLPSPLDPRTGTLYESSVLPSWGGYQLDSHLREVFPYAAVVIERDANAMAFAELRRGAGRDITHFLYLNMGQAIGLGLIMDAHIYRGANGRAGVNLDLQRDNAEQIGRSLAQYVNFIDPELILIGGDSAALGHSFLAAIRRSILDLSQSSSTQHLQVDLAPMGLEANMTGIILLAAEQLFTVEK
jgi:predicted NBD/HSP70 family sugar kinase